jgi:glycosyltransferase involved in cell wall biosynthesis
MPSRPERRAVVLFVLHSLIGGGAERVVVQLINGLDRRRFAPVLALGAARGPYLGDVRADVPLHVLGAERARDAAPAVLRAVRCVKPDVVLSTAGLNLAVAATRAAYPRRTRVILREANSPKAFLDDVARSSGGRERLYRSSYRLLYRQADAIVCQSDAMVDDMADLGVPRDKLTRIYNPVAVERVQALAREPDADPPSDGGGPRLVSVGRLSHQKGFDVLLEALVAVRTARPGATLRIFGDGDERPALEAAVQRLGLGEAVDLPGFSDNPYPAVAAADLFVSSSRYEGFSNAIVEALACGMPVVATDCPSANREVLRAGFNGWLSAPPDDPAALARSILTALDERERMDPEAIRRDCAERFAAAGVVASYEALIEELGGGSERTQAGRSRGH